jgi:hypothetical protein
MELVEWTPYYGLYKPEPWYHAIRFENGTDRIVQANYGSQPPYSLSIHAEAHQVRLPKSISVWGTTCKDSDLKYFMQAKEFTSEDYLTILNANIPMELIFEAATTTNLLRFSLFALSHFDKILAYLTPKVTQGVGRALKGENALTWAILLLQHSLPMEYYSDLSYQTVTTAIKTANMTLDIISDGLSCIPIEILLLICNYVPFRRVN